MTACPPRRRLAPTSWTSTPPRKLPAAPRCFPRFSRRRCWEIPAIRAPPYAPVLRPSGARPRQRRPTALTISACEWDQATQQGTLFAPAPPYSQNPVPAASFDQVLTLPATARRNEPAGADGRDFRLGGGRDGQLHLARQRTLLPWQRGKLDEPVLPGGPAERAAKPDPDPGAGLCVVRRRRRHVRLAGLR